MHAVSTSQIADIMHFSDNISYSHVKILSTEGITSAQVIYICTALT